MTARGQLGPPSSSEIRGNPAQVSQVPSVRKSKAFAEVSADLWASISVVTAPSVSHTACSLTPLRLRPCCHLHTHPHSLSAHTVHAVGSVDLTKGWGSQGYPHSLSAHTVHTVGSVDLTRVWGSQGWVSWAGTPPPTDFTPKSPLLSVSLFASFPSPSSPGLSQKV